MSEEIDDAALNVPRAIFATVILNGSTGFAMVLAVLFCLGDVDAVLVNLQVEPRTHIPMLAIALVTTLPCLLALIYIGSSTVFEDVVSMSTSGLYASYFIPCSLLLWRRTTGQMRPHHSAPTEGDETNGHTAAQAIGMSISEDIGDSEVAQPLLMWGPWRVPGILGIINNAFACVYILFVLFWSFWPPETPATPENMNYSVLVTGFVVLFSIVYYYLYGKAQYMGPLIEHQVRGFARKEL
ncbi:MAG: hypothetical protein Q9168_004606 [Polycauliona sp. 1 TL-2023]